jgi:hypothetical protein
VGASLYWFSYSAGTIAPTDKDAYANFESRRKPPLYYARFQPFSFSLENTFGCGYFRTTVQEGYNRRWS